MLSKFIAIDASPNVQWEDVLLDIGQLLRPFTWKRKNYLLELEKYFADTYRAPFVMAVQSGRSALQLLLSVMIEPGDEVITQAFTCLVVPNAIKWAGGKVVFADIDSKTYNIDPQDIRKKISHRTKVVIVQHTLGIPANLDEVRAICKEHKVFLIEDCAHALGAQYAGQQVGSYGDGAIFSFNQDKVVSSVRGGVLIIKNTDVIKRIIEKQISLKEISYREIVSLLLQPLLWWIALSVYETLSLGKIIIFLGWKIGLIQPAVGKDEEVGKNKAVELYSLSNPQAALVLQQLSRLEKDNTRRVVIANRYKKELVGSSFIHPQPYSNSEPIYLRYPLQVEDPEKRVMQARKKSIILGRWYKQPIIPWSAAAQEYYKEGSCADAEVASEKVINLPTYSRLSDRDVDRIIESQL